MQSGNSFNVGKAVEINKYYRRPFELSVALWDADAGARGADDIVGFWNANQNSLLNLNPGAHSRYSTRNCWGDQARLHFRIERLGYLY